MGLQPEYEDDLEDISENAKAYIREIFAHMKRTWRPEECTVLALMKELQVLLSCI